MIITLRLKRFYLVNNECQYFWSKMYLFFLFLIWFCNLLLDDLVALMPQKYWKMESQLSLWIQVRITEKSAWLWFHVKISNEGKCIHFSFKHAISWTKMYSGLLINLIRFLGIIFLSWYTTTGYKKITFDYFLILFDFSSETIYFWFQVTVF